MHGTHELSLPQSTVCTAHVYSPLAAFLTGNARLGLQLGCGLVIGSDSSLDQWFAG